MSQVSLGENSHASAANCPAEVSCAIAPKADVKRSSTALVSRDLSASLVSPRSPTLLFPQKGKWVWKCQKSDSVKCWYIGHCCLKAFWETQLLPPPLFPSSQGMIHQLAFRKRKRPALGLKAFDLTEQKGQTGSARALGLRKRRESPQKEWRGVVGKSGNF